VVESRDGDHHVRVNVGRCLTNPACNSRIPIGVTEDLLLSAGEVVCLISRKIASRYPQAVDKSGALSTEKKSLFRSPGVRSHRGTSRGDQGRRGLRRPASRAA
jgi:hypothetical protein